MDWTLCKTCQRVVWTTDVDKAGNCIICAPKPVQATPDAPVDVLEPVVPADAPKPHWWKG
jgi:hypothetical protein